MSFTFFDCKPNTPFLIWRVEGNLSKTEAILFPLKLAAIMNILHFSAENPELEDQLDKEALEILRIQAFERASLCLNLQQIEQPTRNNNNPQFCINYKGSDDCSPSALDFITPKKRHMPSLHDLEQDGF